VAGSVAEIVSRPSIEVSSASMGRHAALTLGAAAGDDTSAASGAGAGDWYWKGMIIADVGLPLVGQRGLNPG